MAQVLYLKDTQDRKYMSDIETEKVEQFKRDKEMHRLIRKHCGPNAYSIYTTLVDRANDTEYNGWAFPSYEVLMEDTGIGNRNAITTTLEILFDLGLIEWELNGRHAIYKPVKRMNSTELILFQERAISYQNDTKDSIKTVRPIVSKRYSNVYQSNVNQINELITTPKGVAAPPLENDFEVVTLYQPKPKEPQPPQELLPMPSIPTDGATPGPATDKGRVRVKARNSSEHIPATPLPDLKPKVKGFEAEGGGERDMHAKSKGKPRDERLDNPAVILYRQNCKLTPNEVQRDMIITQVTDLGEWEKNLKYWMGAGYKPGSVDKIVDCYKNQNYKKGEVYGQGRNGKPGFGPDRVGSAQGAGGNGRFLGKFSAFGPSGRLTDKQLDDAW